MARSKTNHRSWTTVAIGRPQYDLLKRAARKRKASPKAVVNFLTDRWAREALGISDITSGTIYVDRRDANEK